MCGASAARPGRSSNGVQGRVVVMMMMMIMTTGLSLYVTEETGLRDN